jgi:DNA primase
MGTPVHGSLGQAGSTPASLRTGKDWAAFLQAMQPAESRGERQPDAAEAWTALVHLARRAGFAVSRADCAAGEGFTTWRNRLIRIRPEATEEQAVTALAHQLGHILLHSRVALLEPSGTVPCRGIRKVEADSVAFLVGLQLGIHADITFPSVTSWAGTDPRARPDATARTVAARAVDAAARIVTRLDEALPPADSLRREAQAMSANPGPAGRPAARGEPRRARDTPAQSGLPLGDDAPVPREELVRAHEDAARFFRERLADSWVPSYLTARGFGPDVLARWQAGYAPAGWSELVGHLRRIGYRDEVIETAGLARRSPRGTLIDTFRDRAVLPIRSAGGTVVAFIGRAAPHAGAGVPKYLNSPGTGLYDKSEVMVGLWEARKALASGARPVIVEGPLDAMAVTGAGGGRYAGAAPCGTALSAQHLAALDAVADLGAAGVLVAFDGDEAGRHAAVRVYHQLTQFTSEVAAVVLPPGQDPAQVLADRGPETLTAILDKSVTPLADLVVDAELDKWSRWLGHAEGQINALHAAATLIAAMPPVHVTRQVARLAERLDLSHTIVTTAITDALPGVIARTDARRKLRGPPTHAPRLAEHDFPARALDATGEPAALAPPPSRPGCASQKPLPARRVLG